LTDLNRGEGNSAPFSDRNLRHMLSHSSAELRVARVILLRLGARNGASQAADPVRFKIVS
jgi:hypothetical protein